MAMDAALPLPVGELPANTSGAEAGTTDRNNRSKSALACMHLGSNDAGSRRQLRILPISLTPDQQRRSERDSKPKRKLGQYQDS